MRLNETPKMVYPPKTPPICTKPDCSGSRFTFHEDGWQCLNCMKIIYRDAPLPYITNNHPDRLGSYNSRSDLYLKNDASNDGYFCPAEIDQNNDSEDWIAEDTTVTDSDFLDWFIDYQ